MLHGSYWSVIVIYNLSRIKTNILQSSSFMLPEVEFWCSPTELDLPRGVKVNWTSPINPETGKADNCLMYNISYEEITEEQLLTGKVDTMNTTTCSAWDYARDKSPESVASQFNLVCGNDYLRSTSQSLYMAGKMVGALGSGLLSDKFGR